jgi:hypothetical protein
MVLVRIVLQVKWGQMQQVVENLKAEAGLMRRIMGPDVRSRILTDLSGPFFTLVQEIEVENLAAWEKLRAKIFSDPDFQKSQFTRQELFESGSQEFYTIEATI